MPYVRSSRRPRPHPYRPRHRRHDTGALDALVLCVAARVVAVGGYGMYDLFTAPESLVNDGDRQASGEPRRAGGGFLGNVLGSGGMELKPGRDQVNVLLLGTDEKNEGGRADTILLVMIRKDTKRAAAISVPRDLMVRLPGYGVQKINAVYAFHRRKGTGEIMTAKTVEQILGVEIDYYIKTDVARFPKLFDALGGLDLYVDRDMKYTDRRGGLSIDLKKGHQHLDGKQIEGFVRHRHDARGRASSDQERNLRQQYVLRELIKQKGNLATVARLPQVIHALEGLIKTNMSLAELTALGLLAKDVDTANVISRVVPSHGRMSGAWYAVLEPQRTQAMMAEVAAALTGGDVTPDPHAEASPQIGGGSLTRTETAGQRAR